MNFIYNLDFVGVPSDFIERIMPKANGSFVKVYLYALNAAVHGRSVSCQDIANALELLESDVMKAFEYLEENGCLKMNGESCSFGEMPETVQTAENEKTEDIPEEDSSGKKAAESVKALMTENETLSEVCQIAQQTLEKTLSDRDLETLYWIYDELGFSPEVILMLLEYCVSREKRSMKYIEKVAISWHENGITTIDAAEKYMNEKNEKNGYYKGLRKLLGIEDRSLSKTEETFINEWRDNYSMSEEMVALAYEYCIIQTGRLSFPYMNSIIKSWFDNNIFTVPDAERDHEDFKKKGKAENDLDVYKDRTGFDYSSIEGVMREKYDG